MNEAMDELGVEIQPEEGILLRRRLPNGRTVEVFPILFGKARLGLNSPKRGDYQPPSYDDIW